jgi:hypothetical protein
MATSAGVRLQNQIIGNVGLYYVCYRLSCIGWNVMPTARNAKGVDLLAYSSDAKTVVAVQVKALTGRNPVPLGARVDNLIGDFFVISRNVLASPECFVLTPTEVSSLAHRGEKDGRVSYWLQPKQYEAAEFREAWHRINGHQLGSNQVQDFDAASFIAKHGSKSEAIRALAAQGKERMEIAQLLGLRYQHVRNVLVTPPPAGKGSR